jgi:hypothetical protein
MPGSSLHPLIFDGATDHQERLQQRYQRGDERLPAANEHSQREINATQTMNHCLPLGCSAMSHRSNKTLEPAYVPTKLTSFQK